MKRHPLAWALLIAGLAHSQEQPPVRQSLDQIERTGRWPDGAGRSGAQALEEGRSSEIPTLRPAEAKAPPPFSSKRASSLGFLGLFPENRFQITTGDCKDCRAPEHSLGYFRKETIALSKSGEPSLVWLGSPEMAEHVSLSVLDDTIVSNDGERVPLCLYPKLPQNRSYYNAASSAFFRGRPLRIRGEMSEKDGKRCFTTRTIWPEDFRLDSRTMTYRMPSAEEVEEDLEHMIEDDQGGVKESFFTRLLWRRDNGLLAWEGRPMLGLMLNGAQGDDDTTHGGHFGFVTGRIGPAGEMADWIVTNFYPLDAWSEKGILAAQTPLDNYLMDLNAGQSYYRPSYMVVAVLKEERAAAKLQDALRGLLEQYYAHKDGVLFDSAKANCTGLSNDGSKNAGWTLPSDGDSQLFPGAAAFVGLFSKGGRDYLAEDRTRLLPRVAFEQGTNDLLAILNGRAEKKRALTEIETLFKKDIDALVFVRMPQVPSSRELGDSPIRSASGYFARNPIPFLGKSTVETPPRPFPPTDQ